MTSTNRQKPNHWVGFTFDALSDKRTMNKPIKVMATKNQTDIKQPMNKDNASVLVSDFHCVDTDTKKPSVMLGFQI